MFFDGQKELYGRAECVPFVGLVTVLPACFAINLAAFMRLAFDQLRTAVHMIATVLEVQPETPLSAKCIALAVKISAGPRRKKV
jgi:hypothetical protein